MLAVSNVDSYTVNVDMMYQKQKLALGQCFLSQNFRIDRKYRVFKACISRLSHMDHLSVCFFVRPSVSSQCFGLLKHATHAFVGTLCFNTKFVKLYLIYMKFLILARPGLFLKEFCHLTNAFHKPGQCQRHCKQGLGEST